MEQILFISNIAKRVGSFSMASLEAAKRCGMQFHIAANWEFADKEQIKEDQNKYNIKIHNISLARSPYSPVNLKAYRQLVEIIKREKIDYIHCNTPVGGVLGRLAGKKCRVKKVIYQAHGFHFYKGAPFKNWLLYYPVERGLAHYTDTIITINSEDYERAKKFRLRNHGKVYYVPGVGIDTSQYHTDEKSRIEKRRELGIPLDAILMISVGELNDNKNNQLIIEALGKMKNESIHYVLCGIGERENELKYQAQKLGLGNNIHFLGYRMDVKALMNASDIFVMPSYREGLSRSIMEAMASGLPCIVSKIRGNVDLIDESKGGFLFSPDDVDKAIESISILAQRGGLRKDMSDWNKKKIRHFDITKVIECMIQIYKEELSRSKR